MNLEWKEVDFNDYDELDEVNRTKWWKQFKFYKDFKIEYEPSKAMFEYLYRLGNVVGVVAHDENNEVAAYFLGFKTPYIFNPKVIYCQEFAWQIREDLQGQGVFRQLMDEIHKLCHNHNIDMISLCLPNEERYALTAKGLEKYGFSEQERMFFKMIKD